MPLLCGSQWLFFTDMRSTSAFSAALSPKISVSLLCWDVLLSQFSVNRAATWITTVLWSSPPECLFLQNSGCFHKDRCELSACVTYLFTVHDCDGNRNAAWLGLLHPSISNMGCICYWEAVLAEKKWLLDKWEKKWSGNSVSRNPPG